MPSGTANRALLFDVAIGTPTALERELSARLEAAEDHIAELEDEIASDAGLLDACHLRRLWTEEDLDQAMPLPEQVAHLTAMLDAYELECGSLDPLRRAFHVTYGRELGDWLLDAELDRRIAAIEAKR